MLRKLNTKKSGFTLVEIMIVVAIIALLATIAVPNFLRARKRAQATSILEEMRIIDGAKDTWAIENNKKGTDTVLWASLTPYFKPGSRLANTTGSGSDGEDLLGNTIATNKVDETPTISTDTYNEFSGIIGDTTANSSFWGSFYKTSGS